MEKGAERPLAASGPVGSGNTEKKGLSAGAAVSVKDLRGDVALSQDFQRFCLFKPAGWQLKRIALPIHHRPGSTSFQGVERSEANNQ